MVSYFSICSIICLLFILSIVIILVVKYIQNCQRIRKEEIKNEEGFTETYKVQNNPNEPEWVGKEVARRLHTLSKKGDALVLEAFNRNYPDPQSSERLAKRWKSIRENNALRETAFGEKSAAYTVNKGDELRICIRDPDKDKLFEDENTSMFVLIHEMAHLSARSWGHNKEFRDNFARLVKLAVDMGIYNYEDFERDNQNYCGTEITSNII